MPSAEESESGAGTRIPNWPRGLIRQETAAGYARFFEKVLWVLTLLFWACTIAYLVSGDPGDALLTLTLSTSCSLLCVVLFQELRKRPVSDWAYWLWLLSIVLLFFIPGVQAWSTDRYVKHWIAECAANPDAETCKYARMACDDLRIRGKREPDACARVRSLVSPDK